MSLANSYKKNGYLVVKKLISKKLIDHVLVEMNDLICRQLVVIGHKPSPTLKSSLKLLFEKDLNRYKKVVSSLWRSLKISRLLHNEIIIDFIMKNFGFKNILLPGGQVIHIQSKSLAIPGGYFGFKPHQDYQSVQGSLDGIIVWIPLCDVDKNNYPLEIIPGSHLNGLYPLKNSNSAQPIIDPLTYSEKDFKSLNLRKGDVVFLSYFTLHRSSESGLDKNVRIACSTRFDNGLEKNFIERCYPTAYTRGVERSKENNFPSKEEIIKIFL